MTPPLITLEEHWYSDIVYDSFDNALKASLKQWPWVTDKLKDADDMRIADMDNGNISFQVISHGTAEDPTPELCKSGNDQLATAIDNLTKKAKRFAGFAVLPPGHPEAAAAELERSVKEFGFVGALFDHKPTNKWCDGPEYDVLWAKAQELDVPLYLHPTWPNEQKDFADRYSGNYSDRAAAAILCAVWGWHIEVGTHVLRLHTAGVFDRFPKLKIILGHFGEGLPFFLSRINKTTVRVAEQKRSFQQVWDENIWITTSGVWSLDPMRCILGNTKIERILYSVDYPFSSNQQGLEWFQELEKSGLLTEEQLEMVAYKNAEALLKIKAPTLNGK